jgi:hypothetical protein
MYNMLIVTYTHKGAFSYERRHFVTAHELFIFAKLWKLNNFILGFTVFYG